MAKSRDLTKDKTKVNYNLEWVGQATLEISKEK